MQRTLILLAMIAFMGACGQSKQETAKIVSASVEELVANPHEYGNKQVALQGMVTHVCRHGGQKCFVVGEDGETQIRIVPGEGIDEFSIDLEGSTVAFKGVFKVLTPVEAEAHVEDHESKEHHAVEQSHSQAEKAEIFLEAVELVEITQ